MNRVFHFFSTNPLEFKMIASGAAAAVAGGYVTFANYAGNIEGLEYKGAIGLCLGAIAYLVNELRLARNESKETVKNFLAELDKKENGVVNNQEQTITLLKELIQVNKEQLQDFRIMKDEVFKEALKEKKKES